MLVQLFELLVVSDDLEKAKLSCLERPHSLSQVHSHWGSFQKVGGETNLRRESLTNSVPCEENLYPSLSLGGNVPIALALTVNFSPFFFNIIVALTKTGTHKTAEAALHFILLLSFN